jgi:hypothetical protein
MDPNVWGIPGGALKGTEGFYDNYENDEQIQFSEAELFSSAQAETVEEIGYLPSGKVVGKTSVSKGNFTYTTFVVEVSAKEKKESEDKIKLNWENDYHQWFGIRALPPDLHPGVRMALHQFMNENDEGDNNLWWHGDKSRRTTFADQIMDRPNGLDKNALGPGIYFSQDKNQAVGYSGPGGWIYGTRIDSDKILTDGRKPTRRFLKNLITAAPKEDMSYGLSNWDENPARALNKAIDAYMMEVSLIEAAWSIRNDFFGDPNTWTAAMVKCGIDGFTRSHGIVDHMVVYNPSVIKVVSEQTYEEMRPETVR